MEKQATWHDQWTTVDHVADPEFFVRFLDATRGRRVSGAQANPEEFYSFLDLHEGHHLLEIGCGTGDFLRPLIQRRGTACRIVGIDNSETMIAEAVKRAKELTLPVEYRVGDAHALALPDHSFDRCYTHFVFMHLENPRQALAEMVRVARPGALIITEEADWDTQTIDATDLHVTRKLIHFITDSIRNGQIGRQLPGFFQEQGLQDISVVGLTRQWSTYAGFEQWWLRGFAERAQEAGVVSADELTAWRQEQEERNQAGRFFATYTTFRVTGRKP